MINYLNKFILAPMVRCNSLPMRLLALKYGANIVYTEEFIDNSMLCTKRKYNDVLETIDYVNEDNACVLFRTIPMEKDNLVFQIGTSNADKAVQVAKMVENDVSAIDINMGCPKSYSTSKGMGAALLSNPERAKEIVQKLIENIKLPITCKIRISDNIDETIRLVRDFEKLGVSAVAVHGRTRPQKRSVPVNKDAIRQVADSVQIPIIANGGSEDIKCLDEMLKFKDYCNASSVMIARAAQKNVSVFQKEGPIPIKDVILEYLKLCVDYDIYAHYVRTGIRDMKVRVPNSFNELKLDEICDLWHIGDYCREKQASLKSKGLISIGQTAPKFSNTTPSYLLKSRKKMFDDSNIISAETQYLPRFFNINETPVHMLQTYAQKNRIESPVFEIKRSDRVYYSILTFQGKQYSSLVWQNTSKYANHAAAICCLHHMGWYQDDFLQNSGCLTNMAG